MRQMKFRAWDGEKMKESFVIHQCNGKAMAQPHLNGPLEFLPDWIVMQFTGLYDKNGVEVYEGDIILPKDISGSGRTRVFRQRPVKWDSEMCEFNVSLPTGSRSIEVIGNIYENPDLLQEVA